MNLPEKLFFSIYNTEIDSRNMGFVRQTQKILTSECLLLNKASDRHRS